MHSLPIGVEVTLRPSRVGRPHEDGELYQEPVKCQTPDASRTQNTIEQENPQLQAAVRPGTLEMHCQVRTGSRVSRLQRLRGAQFLR